MTGFFRSVLIDIAIAAVCSTALLAVLGSSSPRLKEMERARSESTALVRTVADRELVFAREHAPPDEVRRSVASVDAFVGRRAGVSLGPAVAARLADLEQRTLDGGLRRLSVDQVSDVFSEVLVERIRALGDDEIESAVSGFENVVPVGQLPELGDGPEARYAVAKRMRGATGDAARKRADLPRNGVMLRYDGSDNMPADAFARKLREMRERLVSPAVFLLVQRGAREVFRAYLDERLAVLESALPETWGASRSAGLTPLQTVLTAYAAASDDYLAVTSDRLAQIQQLTIDDHI